MPKIWPKEKDFELKYFLLSKNDSRGGVLYNVHVLDANNREVLLDADVETHKREKTLLARSEKTQNKKKQMSSG
jgi:hypothetical protein